MNMQFLISASMSVSVINYICTVVSGKGSKNIADSTKSGGTSVLTSRKSSSTPSLPDATENHSKTSVASTEQAASADNLAAKVQVTVWFLLARLLQFCGDFLKVSLRYMNRFSTKSAGLHFGVSNCLCKFYIYILVCEICIDLLGLITIVQSSDENL
jgi:hypothetical protein